MFTQLHVLESATTRNQNIMSERNARLQNIANAGTGIPGAKSKEQLCRMHQQQQFPGTLGMGQKTKDSSRKFA
jgi:hypothetical protein